MKLAIIKYKWFYLSITLLVILTLYTCACSNDSNYSTYSKPASSPTVEKKDILVVPASPSGLTAQATSSRSVRLTWNDNADNEKGVNIYRNGHLITKLQANSRS